MFSNSYLCQQWLQGTSQSYRNFSGGGGCLASDTTAFLKEREAAKLHCINWFILLFLSTQLFTVREKYQFLGWCTQSCCSTLTTTVFYHLWSSSQCKFFTWTAEQFLVTVWETWQSTRWFCGGREPAKKYSFSWTTFLSAAHTALWDAPSEVPAVPLETVGSSLEVDNIRWPRGSILYLCKRKNSPMVPNSCFKMRRTILQNTSLLKQLGKQRI